jgi:hypothetical protein
VGTAGNGFAVADRWNGTAWAVTSLPRPPGAVSSNLKSVSCAGPADCWAVGEESQNGAEELAFAEHWNGARWSVVVTATSGTHIDVLVGVSCPAAAACMAAGRSLNAALAEKWDGSAWAFSATVTRRAALSAVSCTASFRCAAVGFTVGPASHAFSEIWTGSRWRAVIPALPVGTSLSSLAAVSCPGPADCWAVGGQVAGGTQKSLIEHWNGVAWSIVN